MTRNGFLTLAHRNRLLVLAAIAAVMTGVQLINSFSGYALNIWGVWPRKAMGLPGIVLSPWLHADWSHFAANLPTLMVLGWLAMLTSVRRFCLTSAGIILLGGLLVWLFGRNAVHVGASGWIFGLWAWFLANAFLQRRLVDILIAAAVFFFYGGLFIGLFPKSGVSFEAHIAGVVAGVTCSWWQRRRLR